MKSIGLSDCLRAVVLGLPHPEVLRLLLQSLTLKGLLRLALKGLILQTGRLFWWSEWAEERSQQTNGHSIYLRLHCSNLVPSSPSPSSCRLCLIALETFLSLRRIYLYQDTLIVESYNTGLLAKP